MTIDTATRAYAAIEASEIHRAVCRYRRQQLCCSTCSDLAERALARETAAVCSVPADELVIGDGFVAWSRIAA